MSAYVFSYALMMMTWESTRRCHEEDGITFICSTLLKFICNFGRALPVEGGGGSRCSQNTLSSGVIKKWYTVKHNNEPSFVVLINASLISSHRGSWCSCAVALNVTAAFIRVSDCFLEERELAVFWKSQHLERSLSKGFKSWLFHVYKLLYFLTFREQSSTLGNLKP